jgi:hypothetical protein
LHFILFSFTNDICIFKYNHLIKPGVEGQKITSHARVGAMNFPSHSSLKNRLQLTNQDRKFEIMDMMVFGSNLKSR